MTRGTCGLWYTASVCAIVSLLTGGAGVVAVVDALILIAACLNILAALLNGEVNKLSNPSNPSNPSKACTCAPVLIASNYYHAPSCAVFAGDAGVAARSVDRLNVDVHQGRPLVRSKRPSPAPASRPLPPPSDAQRARMRALWEAKQRADYIRAVPLRRGVHVTAGRRLDLFDPFCHNVSIRSTKEDHRVPTITRDNFDKAIEAGIAACPALRDNARLATAFRGNLRWQNQVLIGQFWQDDAEGDQICGCPLMEGGMVDREDDFTAVSSLAKRHGVLHTSDFDDFWPVFDDAARATVEGWTGDTTLPVMIGYA